jgi:protein involved in polysaccharide export with SLBB domain
MRWKIFVLASMLAASNNVWGQFARKNFTPQIPISEISAQQAEQLRANYRQKLSVDGLTVDPALSEQKALSQRMRKDNDSTQGAEARKITLEGESSQDEITTNELEVFGFSFFKQANFSFLPGENFPTPAKYTLGPGDHLELVIFGYQEAEMNFIIDPEGFVNIPFGGLVQLSGLALEDAEERIKLRMTRNGYRTLSTGESKLKLRVSKIRSINVYITGAKNSGKYVIPSISGLMHALYVAGGPMSNGSLRNIEVVRNSQVVRRIDLYDFMIFGRNVDDFVLQNEDVIRIPFFNRRVSLEGEFKRPAIYELKDSESFADAISFAGGLNDAAFTSNILLSRYTKDQGIRYDNLSADALNQTPMPGDRLIARKVEGPERQYIVIEGMVHNPGRQGWHPGIQLSDALVRAGGLQPEAFTQRGLIVRSPISGARTYHQFSPASMSDIELYERDTVIFFDATVFIQKNEVYVFGEVNEPGAFRFGEGLTLSDAMVLAKGFSQNAFKGFVEVNRRIRGRERMALIERLAIDSTFEWSVLSEISLRPNDIVIVRPNPEIQDIRTVSLEGEWEYPGTYALEKRTDRLSMVIGRAGGLSRHADLNGIYIIRTEKAPVEINKIVNIGESRKKLILDSTTVPKIDTISLNLSQRSPKSFSFNVQSGDRIIALEQKSFVRITGAVHDPILVSHVNSRSAKYYIGLAGGSLKEGELRKTYVTFPNGSNRRIKNYLIFKIYPKVPPGSTVVVPFDMSYFEDTQKTDPAQVAMVTSVLGFLSTSVIGILSLLR